MKKISFKSIIQNFLLNIARSFQGRKFLPALIWGIVRAVLATLISAFALDKSFSGNPTINQIYSAVFFYLLMTTLMLGFKDIRRGGFGRRFLLVGKRIYTDLFSKETTNGRKIAYFVFAVFAIGVTQFMPPLFTLMLGISVFLSSVAGEQSQILLLVEPFKRPNKDGVNTRGTYLSKLGLGILLGCLISTILFACGVYKMKVVEQDIAESFVSSGVDDIDNTVKPDSTNEDAIVADEDENGVEIETNYTFANPFPQKFTLDSFVVSSHDSDYFYLDSQSDYLLTCFDGYTYSLWVYDETGYPYELYGKVIFESEEALLDKMAGEELSSGEYNENGYTYFDNVLYYFMPEEILFDAGESWYKYDKLAVAESGAWDNYFYFFSKPYDTLTESEDYTSEQTVESNDEGEYADDSDDSYLNEDLDESSMNDIESAALSLATNMIMNAGVVPMDEFTNLFVNTGEDVINQYYTATYKDVTTYEKSLATVVSEAGDYARVTIMYYSVPDDYPQTEEDVYTFSGIFAKNSEGEWKLDASDEAINALNDANMKAVMTEEGYEAYNSGAPYVRKWVQFNTDIPLVLEGVFTHEVIEFYQESDGAIDITLYLSNGTANTIDIGSLDSLIILDGTTELLNIGADLNISIEPGAGVLYTIYVQADYVSQYGWTNPTVGEFVLQYQ